MNTDPVNTTPELPPANEGEITAAPNNTLRALIGRLPYIPIAAVLLVLFGLSMLALSLQSQANHPLYPLLPTRTPLAGTVDFEPVQLSFSELNNDPASYLGRRIQVSGVYTTAAPPECVDYSGPSIRWTLVADELQLNAVGFENVLRLIESGVNMTVTGVWSAYHGPAGCGKAPPDATVWYLAVDHILEPNPLIGANGIVLTVVAGELPTQSPFETPPPSVATETPSFDDPGGEEFPSTEQPDFPPGELPPPPGATDLPVTPLVTPGATDAFTTPTAEGTIDEFPPTADPNATPTPEDGTPGTQPTQPPGLPTTTPGGPGYPGQQPTPEATQPPGGYP